MIKRQKNKVWIQSALSSRSGVPMIATLLSHTLRITNLLANIKQTIFVEFPFNLIPLGGSGNVDCWKLTTILESADARTP